MAQDTDRITPHAPEAPPESDSLFQEALRHKTATAALLACIVAGMVISAWFLPESIALPRRIAGGAVLGGLSWLLVMVGRLIDG